MKRSRLADASDRDLAEALLNGGDEGAFRELYSRHTGRLFQFVLRLVGGNEQEAEDLVQESWIRAAEGLAQFRWESQFSTWLTGIGLNLCRDRIRQVTRRAGVTHLHVEDGGLRAGAVPPERPEERIDLERAIARLPPGYRQVLVLHDVEGLTHAEIGTRLGIAEGTSKSQLYFARRTMRRLLAQAGERTNGRSSG